MCLSFTCNLNLKPYEMNVVSLTFHTPEKHFEAWSQFMEEDLPALADNLFDVEKYMLAEVESEMITEGRNTNLLLFFESEEKRTEFLQIELENIAEILRSNFGEDIMIFTTMLQPKKLRF